MPEVGSQSCRISYLVDGTWVVSHLLAWGRSSRECSALLPLRSLAAPRLPCRTKGEEEKKAPPVRSFVRA